MTETRSYGTWTNHGGGRHRTLAETVREAIEDPAGIDIDGVIRDYTAAIEAALPPGVTFHGGAQFYGHASDRLGPDGWGDYPVDADGNLDLTAIVESVDMWALVDKHIN